MKSQIKTRIASLLIAFALIAATIIPLSGTTVSGRNFTRRTTSQVGINMIRAFEGFSRLPYWDWQQWSVGYGTSAGGTRAAGPARFRNGITRAQAMQELMRFLGNFENSVNNFLSRHNIFVTQNQFDAMIGLTYNMGGGIWTDTMTIGRLLREGRHHVNNNRNNADFINAFEAWSNVTHPDGRRERLAGLVARRSAEVALFLTPDFSVQSELYVIMATTNIRAGAGAAHPSVGTLNRGAVITVTNKRVIGTLVWGQFNHNGQNVWASIGGASQSIIPIGANNTSVLRPILRSVTNRNGAIRLDYTRVPGAAGYRIYRRAGAGGEWTRIGTINNNTTLTFTDRNVTAGQRFYYAVEAFRGNEARRSHFIAIYHVAPPTLRAITRVPNTINLELTWNAAAGAAGYHVLRRPAGTGEFTQVAAVGANTTSFIIRDVTPGQRYEYTVRLHNSLGVSGYRAPLTAVIVGIPRITLATDRGEAHRNSVRLNIQGQGVADRLILQRLTPGQTEWQHRATLAGTATAFNDNTIPAEGAQYRLRAVLNGYESDWSAPFSVRPLNTPQNLRVSNVANGLRVRWNAVAGATRYRVYRRAVGVAGAQFRRIATVTTTEVVDTGRLVAQRRYTYRVVAATGISRSRPSAQRTLARRPSSAITRVDAAAGGGVRLTARTMPGAVRYYFYRQNAAGRFIRVGRSNTNNFVYTGARNNVNNVYSVRVRYSSGSSALSAPFNGIRLARANVTARAGAGRVTLSWNNVRNASAYDVYRRVSTQQNFRRIGRANSTEFVDRTARAGRTYVYRVVARRGRNLAVHSAPVNARAR